MKKIMILGASILQLPAIIKAKEMGLQVIVVDMNPNAVGFKEKDVICEIISTIDTPKVLEAAKKYKIDGIMTLASDMPMRTVAVVANELELVGISEQTAFNATNKAMMRQCLKENNVPIPEFFKAANREEYFSALDYFKRRKTKCIVKPADNSGSRGVEVILDFENNEYLEDVYKYSKEYSRCGDVVIEEYMEGSEVSVETLSLNGECHVIQITDKLTTGAPYFVEMGHNEPSLLNEEIQQMISEVAVSAVKAIGVKNGPSHTEIKVTKDGPKIVELGARLGGDNITTHLVPLSTGVDMVEGAIRIALGETPDLKPKFSKGSAIRYLKTDSGIIQSISGIEESRKVPGIKQISIVHDVGDKALKIKSSVDRVGFVIAQDETPVRAISDCEKVLKMINIVVKPIGGGGVSSFCLSYPLFKLNLFCFMDCILSIFKERWEVRPCFI